MKNLIAVLIIFFASVLLSLPLTKPGLHQIHDDQQVARLYLLDQAIKAGQFPPRWVDGLGFGFGYPLFIFYPPLVYYLGEIYHLVGFDFVDSTKLVFFTSILASGLAMYVLCKKLWGKVPAVVASIFYLFLPYRALDIYVRGALAESFSFVFFPLILWAFYKLYEDQTISNLALAALFLALLMITHNLMFLPFMMLLPFFLAFLFFQSKNKQKFTIYSVLSVFFAFALSCFFWLPSLAEKKFTIVDDLLLINLANYNRHFVYLQQLWNWPWGFGGSTIGLADGVSFKIGKLHVIVSAIALLFSLFAWAKGGRFRETLNFKLTIVFAALFVFSAFMTTEYSKLVWDTFSPIGYLQFPWRFLTFTGLFSSILAAYFIYSLRLSVLKLAASAVVIFLLIYTNLKLFNPQNYRFDLTDEVVTSDEYINWYVSTSSFEYVPKGVELYINPLGANSVKIEKNQIPQTLIETQDENTKVTVLENSPGRIKLDVSSEKNTEILVNRFYFPGWKAEINGKEANISNDNQLRLINLTIPPSSGQSSQVEIMFTETPIRSIANMISLISLFALFGIFIKNAARR